MVSAEQEAQIQKGVRLLNVKNSDGWKDLVEIMQSISDEITHDLLTCDLSNRDKIVALHAEAQAAKMVWATITNRIDDYINNAKELAAQPMNAQL